MPITSLQLADKNLCRSRLRIARFVKSQCFAVHFALNSRRSRPRLTVPTYHKKYPKLFRVAAIAAPRDCGGRAFISHRVTPVLAQVCDHKLIDDERGAAGAIQAVAAGTSMNSCGHGALGADRETRGSARSDAIPVMPNMLLPLLLRILVLPAPPSWA